MSVNIKITAGNNAKKKLKAIEFALVVMSSRFSSLMMK